MCLTPITLLNPHYHCGDLVFTKDGKKLYESSNNLNYLHNTRDKYIQVPCGRCSQCLSQRQGFINQRVQMESFRSHLFMMTLTYNNQSLKCTDIGEYKVPYPDYKDVQNMFKRLRLKGHVFRYMVVSEYGSKKKRPHYHAIIAIPKTTGDWMERRQLEYIYSKLFLAEWRRNVGCNKFPVWQPLCDYIKKRGRSTFDFHEIIPVSGHDNDVSFYLSKYLLKYDSRTDKLLKKISLDPNLNDEQTSELFSKLKPRMVMSKDFGSYKIHEVQVHIARGLSLNKDCPQFLDLYTGKTMLLSPYYRSHLLPLDWKQEQYERLSVAKEFRSFEMENTDTILDCEHKSDKVARLQKQQKRINYLLSQKY